MGKFVIGPDVALRLAAQAADPSADVMLLAPTLMRSELLNLLFQAVREGRMSRASAEEHLDYVRRLRIRLLGDKVLQAKAWRIADELGLSGTFEAEYIALTQLQADALVTTSRRLRAVANQFVSVAPVKALL